MVAERAGRGARRGAGAAVERALQHGGTRVIGQEAELRDGGSEQRDDWRADAGGHVHDTRIARHHDPRPREERAGFLERKLAGGARDGVSPFGNELLRQPAVFRPPDDDRPVPGGPQPLGERAPVRDGPAFGGVGGARRERREPRLRKSALREPLRGPVRGAGAQAELGRPAVGPSVEPARGLEVALGDRGGRASAVGVQLGGDEQRAGQLALAIPRPAAAHEQSEARAADAAVQVEAVRRCEGAQPAGEETDRLARLERHDLGEMRVVGHERRHGALRHVHELRLRVATGERSHKRRSQQDVADGAEADQENAQHVAK